MNATITDKGCKRKNSVQESVSVAQEGSSPYKDELSLNLTSMKAGDLVWQLSEE